LQPCKRRGGQRCWEHPLGWGPRVREGPGPDPAATVERGVKGLTLREGKKVKIPSRSKEVELEMAFASWEGGEEVPAHREGAGREQSPPLPS